MMYSSFPKANKQAYAAMNSPIAEQITLSKIDSTAKLTIQKRLNELQIIMADSLGEVKMLSYPSLKPITGYNEQSCIAMATACAKSDVSKVEAINDYDMWIPWQSFKEHFPIYKCWMNDGKGTVMYVSSKTGQVVQETNRKNRFWSYLGAIPHWVYIKQLRLHIDTWKNTIIVLSALGSIMCLAGLVLGVMLVRKKSLSPYRKKWFRWHHLLGLLFGLSTFTYVFSGMMSLCDIPSFIAKQPDKGIGSHQPASVDLRLFTRSTTEAIRLYPSSNKIEFLVVNGSPYYKMTDGAGNVAMVSGDSTTSAIKKEFTTLEAVNEYQSNINKASYQIIQQKEYDSYYMPTKRGERPLPVYQLKVDDAYQSVYYINPKTLELLSYQSSNSRIERWTYSFLHCYNSYWLVNHPFVRRGIEVVLMLGGLMLSVTSVLLTLKKVRRRSTRRNLA